MGGWGDEFDAQVGPEVFGTSGGLSCSIISNSLKILENRNEWPSGSVRFFMRDHQIQGNGLRGLVFKTQKSIMTSHHLEKRICLSISILHPFTMDFPPQSHKT